MAVSNQEIQNWLAANPTASDATIAKAMDQYGVTPAQMASATGMDVGAVQSRYNAATGANTGATTQTGNTATTQTGNTATTQTGNVATTQTGGAASTPTTQEIKNWLAANPRATDAQIAAAMNQYGVSPTQMAAATGLSLADVQNRYNTVSPTGQFYKPTTTTTTTTKTGTGTTTGTGTGIGALTGGSSGNVLSGLIPSQQQLTQQSIAPYLQPYVGSMMGATMGQLFNTDASGNITGLRGYTPYSYNPADYYAAFTPMQQQAFYNASQLQTPGQIGQASQAANAGILGALSAGGRYGQMATDPYAAAAFMSPYYQNVVNTQMQQAKRQADIAAQTQQAQAAKAGAFGGARDIIQRQQAASDLQRNLANIQATGTQAAYQDAMKNIQNVANLGLQGAQAGITGAGTLGQLGTSQLGAQTGILGLQSQMGQQQQQQQQNIINQAVQNYQTAQQYPYMQLGFMQNMMQGLPVQSTTQQTYAAPPNKLAQLAGAGTGLYALSQMLGGGTGLTGTLNSIGDTVSNAANQGFNALTSFLPAAKGGSTQDIEKRGAGLADLAVYKLA